MLEESFAGCNLHGSQEDAEKLFTEADLNKDGMWLVRSVLPAVIPPSNEGVVIHIPTKIPSLIIGCDQEYRAPTASRSWNVTWRLLRGCF